MLGRALRIRIGYTLRRHQMVMAPDIHFGVDKRERERVMQKYNL